MIAFTLGTFWFGDVLAWGAVNVAYTHLSSTVYEL